MVNTIILVGSIALACGIILGVTLARSLRKEKELSVEDAIALLKSKEYWVTLNVNPKKE